MPEMDGWEMLTRLRADQELAAVPVIAVTAYAMTEDEKQVVEAGFDGYIAKPFDILTPVDEVKHILTNSRR